MPLPFKLDDYLDRRVMADVVEKPIYQAAAIRPQGVFLGLQPQYEVARRVV
jgi:hypothetical protein